MTFLARLWKSGVIGTFLTGFLALLPLILTVMILQWLASRISGAIGPGSFLGDLIAGGGTTFTGPGHAILAWMTGAALVLVAIWAFGVFVRVQAKRGLDAWLDRLLSRVPVIRSIYKPVAQIVRLLKSDGEGELKRMKVVMVRFGPAGGADVLALQASPQSYTIGGLEQRLIFVPFSPIPMSGGLMFVPEKNVTPVPEMAVDDLLQVYVSIGALAPKPESSFDNARHAPTETAGA